jgi:alpha-1,2-mannosyltransferase
LSLSIVALVLWALVVAQFVHQTRSGFPIDFVVYRDAALNMLHGGATYRAHFTDKHLNFTYTPFSLMLFSVVTVSTRLVALTVWSLFSVSALVTFVNLALRKVTELSRKVTILTSLCICAFGCLFLEPVRSSLDFGQINFFLMLAILTDILGVWSKPRGILMAVAAAVKLTPLIYMTYFLMVRSRASLLRALGTFTAAIGLAWLILPSDSSLFWFHQAFSPGHKGGAEGTANQSWFGLLGHFRASLGSSITAPWLVLSLLTCALGIQLARRYAVTKRPVEALLALALTELLVSPVSWAHHWSWIVLLPVLLIARWRQDPYVRAAMLLLLIVAAVAPYRWYRYSWYDHGLLPFFAGFSLLLAGVVLLLTMAVTEWQRARAVADSQPDQYEDLSRKESDLQQQPARSARHR